MKAKTLIISNTMDNKEANMKKLMVISLILLLSCSISFPVDASGFLYSGLFGGLGIFHSKDEKSNDDKEKVIEREFKTGMGKLLDLQLKTGGSIKIKGWDQEKLYVKVTMDGEDWKDCKVEFEESEKGISISSMYEEWKRNRNVDCLFEINVPRKYNITLNTMGGDVNLDNIDGSMKGETMGGKLILDNLKGELVLTTMGGSIILTNSEVDGKVSSMGGQVRIKDVKGDIQGSSMGGNVSYENVTRKTGDMGSEANISTMGGDINLDQAPLGANLSTMGGDITVNSVKKFVRANTMGGHIEIKDADGRIDATTMAGNIDVTVTGNGSEGGHDVKLLSKSGDITLTVPADFSMDVAVKLAYTKHHEGKSQIISDFDLKQENDKDWNHNHGSHRKFIHGSGSFNGGKNRVFIETVNGNVYLKKM